MSSKLPPKTPSPEVTIINHHCLDMTWKDIMERLLIIMPQENLVFEISMKKINNFDEPWIVKYVGYADNHVVEDCDQDCEYAYRMRLRNKVGWGEYSDLSSLRLPKEPVTGDDLHKAIIMDDEALLMKLLESGLVKVNVPDRFDYTPLMACILRNLENLMKCLLSFGVDIDVQNKSGKSALMIAANKGNTRLVQLLLNEKANPKLKDRSGMSALFYAIDSENQQIVKMLIQGGCNVNDVIIDTGWTPLIRLAVLSNNGNAKIGQILIQSGAEINQQDVYGQTALIHCSYHNNHHELAKTLLLNGANSEIKNKSGFDAYQIARSMNNTAIILVLEEVLKLTQ